MFLSAGAALMISVTALAQTAEQTVEELQKQLRQRDKLIQNLVRRVEKLEQRVGKASLPEAGPTVTRAALHSQVAMPTSRPSEVAQAPDQPAPAPEPAAPPPPPAAQPPAGASPPAPGQFEVSEETAERALERTLVATGNLVVPQGFAEIQPLFSYARTETPTLIFFNGVTNQLTPAIDTRVGLPWESQIELFLPWNFVESKITNISIAPNQQVSDRWGNGFGDLNLGFTKTFVHESGWIPGLLGRVSYEFPTGPLRANQVFLPSGQSKLNFSLTALKRQDPLVFVATGGYTKAFQANQINPGDQQSFQIGAFLATSPETSLRGVVTQTFFKDVTINGVKIPGSNQDQSTLTFGVSSILGRGILVDLAVGIGLTNATPKYAVQLSSSYRFPVTGQ
jgi:hypothetical protein